MNLPPLPPKKRAVFHHPNGMALYDGWAMDMYAIAYAELIMKEIEELRSTGEFYKQRCESLQALINGAGDAERKVVWRKVARGIANKAPIA